MPSPALILTHGAPPSNSASSKLVLSFARTRLVGSKVTPPVSNRLSHVLNACCGLVHPSLKNVYRTLEPDEPFDGQRIWYVAIYSLFYPNLISRSRINGHFDDNTPWGAFMLSEVDSSTIITGR